MYEIKDGYIIVEIGLRKRTGKGKAK